ncbi:MAG: PaaI family thioesterase [Thermoplasmataceae archaeon]
MLNVEDAYKVFQLDGFLRDVKISEIHLEEDFAEVVIPLEDNLLRLGNIMNGGAIMAVGDAAGGICVMTGEGVMNEFTVNFHANFLRQISLGPVKFSARTKKNGKSLAFCQIDVFDGNDELCATMSGTWYVVR